MTTFLRVDAVKAMLKDTPPRCFHCGVPYVRDLKHCGNDHSTWMPLCNCISKPSIRIVTGGEIEVTEGDDGEWIE